MPPAPSSLAALHQDAQHNADATHDDEDCYDEVISCRVVGDYGSGNNQQLNNPDGHGTPSGPLWRFLHDYRALK